MSDKNLLRDCNSKRLYVTDHSDEMVIEFKDNTTEFDGDKKVKFKDKGALKNTLNAVIFEYLEGFNIPTHLEEQIDETTFRAKKLQMIPISVVVRNVAAGSLSDRFMIGEGTELP